MEGDEFGNGAIGTHGGVSSGSVYASQAGLEILQAGRQRRGRGGWPPLSQWACVSPT